MRTCLYTILALAGLIVVACQQSEWDDHYTPSDTSKGTLLEVMSADGHFNSFLTAVREAGRESLLTGTQTFTIWAPTDESIQSANISSALTENHISRYLYGAEDLIDNTSIRVKMLNGKYLDFTHTSGYAIGDMSLTGRSLAASNGIVHGIGGIIPLRQNLYEKIKNDERFSWLADYLTTFDEEVFDGQRSISIGQNEYGQTIYDSIFNYSSYWMKHHGSIYSEDSIYTMLLPTNTAYEEGKARIKPCFRTFGEILEDDSNSGRSLVATRTYALNNEESDSLQQIHTMQAMAGCLVFRKTVDPQTSDSLINTSGQIFHQPRIIFSESVQEPVSNGMSYVTDRWKIPENESWNRSIRIEAENAVHRQLYTTTPTTYDATTPEFIGQVSKNQWLEVENSSTSARLQPQILFDIPGTLATSYNIYAVFVPGLARDATHQGDSTKVVFYLNYVHEDGTMHEDNVISVDPVTGNEFVTNGKKITRFLIAKNFHLPYANINMCEDDELETIRQEAAVKIRIQTNVAANETTLMNKVMRIDCFILEPVTED